MTNIVFVQSVNVTAVQDVRLGNMDVAQGESVDIELPCVRAALLHGWVTLNSATAAYTDLDAPP